MAQVFFSYSHKDEALRNELEVHLAVLKRTGFIEAWHDRRIIVGSDFAGSISDHLETANVILLLVSADFLASDYCHDVEMKRALERHAAGEARAIPVILRACDWLETNLGKLLAAPTDGKPVTAWADRDQAFLDVTKHIKAALHGEKRDTRSDAPGSATTHQRAVRSSNLRISKEFTDHERDEFLRESFEHIAAYFANSLEELRQREPSIQTTFRRVDANRFEAQLYRAGTAVSQCAISVGDAFGLKRQAISYSDSLGRGVNHQMQVESDEQRLYLKPWAPLNPQSRDEEKLTMTGGAEQYWSAFIERLQRRR